MRAAVVASFAERIKVQDVPKPEPGDRQILVRMEASGLCRADLRLPVDNWPVTPTLPFVPGQGAVGTVAETGPGVTGHGAGDRVAVPWLGHACGVCEYCVGGREDLCEEQLNTGSSLDGGHAEFFLAEAEYAVRVPARVDPHHAAVLTGAGLPAYKAIKVGGVAPGDRVAIFGIGGLGHLALQYARIFGGETVAVDVRDDRLAQARLLGVRHVVNAAETDPVEAIQKLGGADVAVVLTAEPKVLEQAHASLRRGGRLVLVVLPSDDTMSLPVSATVFKGIAVIGTTAGTRADLAEVFRLHAAGHTRVRYEARPLERINDAIDEVLGGTAPAPLVIVP